MRADYCGTLSEQARYRLGWITPTERKERCSRGELKPGHICGQKCQTCVHLDSSGKHCALGNFATRPNAYCDRWQLKVEPEK